MKDILEVCGVKQAKMPIWECEDGTLFRNLDDAHEYCLNMMLGKVFKRIIHRAAITEYDKDYLERTFTEEFIREKDALLEILTYMK